MPCGASEYSFGGGCDYCSRLYEREKEVSEWKMRSEQKLGNPWIGATAAAATASYLHLNDREGGNAR